MADNIKFDIKKLSDQQLTVALKIIEAAHTVGVDPNQALAISFIESRFDPNVPNSSAGAIGVMQLLPGTAKDMGVDPNNLDENILGGVKYMKYLLDHPQVGGNSNLMMAAYHDGPNSEFFKTGDKSKISDNGVLYVHAANQLMQGKRPTTLPGPVQTPAEAAAPEAPTAAPAAAPTAEPSIYDLEIAQAKEDQAQQQYGFSPGSMTAGAIPGAAIGAGVGTYQAVQPAASGVLQALTSLGGPSGPVPPGAPGAAGGLPPAQGPAQRTPLGGRMTQNYARSAGMTEFDAARARDMSKRPGGAWDVARQAAEAEQKIGPGWRMTPERADLMLPENVGGGPRGARRVPVPPVRTGPGVLQRASSVMAGHPLIAGPMAGATMGAEAAEAAERYRTGDIPGATVMGGGALGSALGMFPRLLPRMGPVGMAASLAAPVITGIMDYTRNRDISPASISADMLRELKQWEQQYKANIEKSRGGPGGFSLPVMQP